MSAIAYNPNYPIDDKRFVEAVRLLASNFADTVENPVWLNDYDIKLAMMADTALSVVPQSGRGVKRAREDAYATVPTSLSYTSDPSMESEHDIKVPRASSVDLSSDSSEIHPLDADDEDVEDGGQDEFDELADVGEDNSDDSSLEDEDDDDEEFPDVDDSEEAHTERSSSTSPGKRSYGQERYYCDFPGCGKSFCRGYSLKYHKYTHTNDAPYMCRQPGCGKRFSHQSRLKRHQFSHNPEDRCFSCDIGGCGKKFSQKCHLKIHMQTHARKK